MSNSEPIRLRLAPRQWDTLRALLIGTELNTEDAQVREMCRRAVGQIDRARSEKT